MTKVICFHGTDENAARCILQSGFFPDCWFAHHLENAIYFGGPHVFEVAFDDPPGPWQFHVPSKIGPERIIRYQRFQVTTVFKNDDLRREVWNVNRRLVQPPYDPVCR